MRSKGFSLLELLVTLGLVVLLFSLAVPGLRDLSLDARRLTDVNAFVTAIQLARSESAKQARPVVLCQTTDARVCGDSGAPYEQGWMLFVDEDADAPPLRDPDETLLLHYIPVIDGSIRSNRAHYVFRPYFRRSTNGTVVFCDIRGPAAARAVIVSYTGRPRIASNDAGGRPLRCAG